MLQSNFKIEKYGLQARLVNEDDAEFIIKLRSQDKARFMNSVSTNVEQQKDWIRQYKIREELGQDYYFVFYQNEIPCGLNRMYNIQKDSFVGGSFVFLPDCGFETPIYSQLMLLHIGFELLNKSICFGNIHKDNKNAIKFNRKFGADFIYEDENEYFILMSIKTYFEVKNKFESIL